MGIGSVCLLICCYLEIQCKIQLWASSASASSSTASSSASLVSSGAASTSSVTSVAASSALDTSSTTASSCCSTSIWGSVSAMSARCFCVCLVKTALLWEFVRYLCPGLAST